MIELSEPDVTLGMMASEAVAMMTSKALGEKRVGAFVEDLFGEDLHAKRVLSLTHSTLGATRAGALGIHAIGQGLALARGMSRRHSVKQVDRFLGNSGISPWELLSSWVPFAVGGREEIVVALDWTDFDADGHCTIAAHLVTKHGRATPLAWLTVEKDGLKDCRSLWEDTVLQRLRETLPATVKRVIILGDRAFGDTKLYALLAELKFDFVIRFRGIISVESADGESRSAGEWVGKGGRAKKLAGAKVTGNGIPVPAVVCVHAKGMKEAWCLASSLSEATATEIVKLYGRRFTIEESFRDLKDLRFGMGLSWVRVSTVDRRDKLLLVSALAVALLTLLGAAGEAVGIDRHFKTNTSAKRQHSLFRQGCMYYEFLPTMRDEWARPLTEKFAALMSAQEALRATFGLI